MGSPAWDGACADDRTMQYGLYLPNFGAFDIKTQVVYALPVQWSYVVTTSAYGVAYIALLLAGAVAIFSRRDFK